VRFVVGSYVRPEAAPVCVLMKENWNDWFKWYTLYSVTVIQPDGSPVALGAVKIGQRGMVETQGSTELPASFATLDPNYFSLGQSENYYETLIQLGDEFRANYLQAVRDCAYEIDVFEANKTESVMVNSLLRYIETARVRERFNRLAHGQVELTRYSFSYELSSSPLALAPPPILTFEVQPTSMPATNIHVLIGRNGVGKTRCFEFLARSLLGIPADDSGQSTGTLRNTQPNHAWNLDANNDDPGFTGLVTVAFSAFDSKGPLYPSPDSKKRYSYIGLVTDKPLPSAGPQASPVLRVKPVGELAQEFADSVVACREGVRRSRWKAALESLEADPLFEEANVTALAEPAAAEVESRARNLFLRLSSGHAAVLLSITLLVQHVEEKSLVLVDEPEGHLHPPLLSAFVRALSQLMINRNGVAVVATHSPVVLQEVPSACVWKLGRAGHQAVADRPERETFGENLGVLTREVFGLEVTQTGFHKLILDQAPGRTYDQLVAKFGGQLGAEGRALARALTLPPLKPEG
jgi:ABC-type cobalamin/Fe3+-siderophores transport system ATPase subunit